MDRRLVLVCSVLLALSLPGIVAAQDHGSDFMVLLNAALDEGRIDRDEWFLNLFHFAFDPARVRPDLAIENPQPFLCFTWAIGEYLSAKQSLRPATVETLENYLARPTAPGEKTSTYDSPGGYFRLTYETSGPDSVSLDDVDPPNGIPDFIEWVADYADSSWRAEIDWLGFNAPVVPPGEKYMIYFELLGVFGYCQDLGGGESRIVINTSNYSNPGPTDDPEGDQKGFSKVVLAHEFKHASQINTNGCGVGTDFWSGWMELDAMWIMDIVFDESNASFIKLEDPESPILNPHLPLVGNYSTFIWQVILSETWGIGMGLNLTERREAHPTEMTTKSYANVISDQGSGWVQTFTDYITWNYLTGVNNTASLPGYQDAAEFPDPGYWKDRASYPDTTVLNDWVSRVLARATHVHKCLGLETLAENLRIQFTSEVRADITPRLVALFQRKEALGGGWFREDITIDSTNSADYTLSMPGADLDEIAVLVINAKRESPYGMYYTLILSDGVTTDVAVATPVTLPFGLDRNRPNPFNPATTISFTLPRGGTASLAVYNQAGRLIRTLVSGEMFTAGVHNVQWDGKNDRFMDVASGVYYCRLVSENKTDTGRMVLIR